MHTSTVRDSSVLGWITDVAVTERRGTDAGFSPFELESIHRVLSTWWTRATTRRQLAQMDDSLLSDIGISRADALREVRKPFWRA